MFDWIATSVNNLNYNYNNFNNFNYNLYCTLGLNIVLFDKKIPQHLISVAQNNENLLIKNNLMM